MGKSSHHDVFAPRLSWVTHLLMRSYQLIVFVVHNAERFVHMLCIIDRMYPIWKVVPTAIQLYASTDLLVGIQNPDFELVLPVKIPVQFSSVDAFAVESEHIFRPCSQAQKKREKKMIVN